MTCKNCGAEIPENAKFCPKCGASNNAEEMNVSAAGSERAVPRGFSSKKNIIIIIIAAVLLIGGGVTAFAVVNSHSASSGITDKLQLAERYLSEQNYEQAIIEYEKILGIEPMNVDAYIGLAKAYIETGDTDKAIETLQEGIEKTGDVRLKEMLEELTKKPETSSISDTSTNTSKPTENPPVQVSGTVTILGEEYDIATTTYLSLFRRRITDNQLEEISKLTNLTYLDLGGNQITNITPLSNLTNLTELLLGGNQISDITPLSNLTNLTELWLGGNQINDITPLSNLTNLTLLDLYENKISDITSLSKLTNLTKLYLYDNITIRDITPLSNLTNLTELYLYGNYISAADIESLKKQLPNCNIR